MDYTEQFAAHSVLY